MVDSGVQGLASGRRFSAIILDYGEVLCLRPSSDALASMAGVFGIELDGFLPIYRASRNPYDRGDFTPQAYWTEFARRAGVMLDTQTIENLRRLDMQMWSNVNQEMTEWLTRIHSSGFRTAILSNMQSDMAAHMRGNFDWLRHFDHHVFSCEVRSVKPDPFIYRHTLGLLNSPPSEVLFIDDREENIQAARAAGIGGIVFESVSQLRGDLKKIGFSILPEPSGDGPSSR